MHAATGTVTLLLQCDFRGQPSVVESSSSFFGVTFSISVNVIPLLYCCVPCATRVCAVCAVCHAWSAFKVFFLVGSPRFCAGEAFFAVSATKKIPGMH